MINELKFLMGKEVIITAIADWTDTMGIVVKDKGGNVLHDKDFVRNGQDDTFTVNLSSFDAEASYYAYINVDGDLIEKFILVIVSDPLEELFVDVKLARDHAMAANIQTKKDEEL